MVLGKLQGCELIPIAVGIGILIDKMVKDVLTASEVALFHGDASLQLFIVQGISVGTFCQPILGLLDTGIVGKKCGDIEIVVLEIVLVDLSLFFLQVFLCLPHFAVSDENLRDGVEIVQIFLVVDLMGISKSLLCIAVDKDGVTCTES